MNLLLIAVAFLILRKRIGKPILVLGATAWLTHLLLDSFYNHNRGIAIYWPFSDSRLNFGMPWFNNLDLSQSPISNDNLWVYIVEAIAFAPVLAVAIAGTNWYKNTLRRENAV